MLGDVAKQILRQSNIDPVGTLESYLTHVGVDCDKRLLRALAISVKYAGYIKRADTHNEKITKLDKKVVSWKELCESENISFECKERIKEVKPDTFGQLRIIRGIRPATLAVVASNSL